MRLLYATDLSAASEAAIRSETRLACLEQVGVDEINLVTVVPSNVHAGMPGIDVEQRRRDALTEYERVISASGFGVESHVVRGTPHRRINGIAETVHAELVLIGSRGSSPLANRVLGSTARNLSRSTSRPLLVNRIERETDDPDPTRSHLFQRMLYATDFSENAERAFEWFSSIRAATQEATLVHVRKPKGENLGEPPAEIREPLDELADQLESWGIETRVDIRSGDPADQILEAEAEHEPTTILVGSRGSSRLRRLLLGSVSERIVAEAAGNVLLVPPTERW